MGPGICPSIAGAGAGASRVGKSRFVHGGVLLPLNIFSYNIVIFTLCKLSQFSDPIIICPL